MWDDILVKLKTFPMRDKGFCGFGWAMIALESPVQYNNIQYLRAQPFGLIFSLIEVSSDAHVGFLCN